MVLPVQVAAEAAKEVSKAVSNDIAVLRTKFDVETGKGRKKRLTPVEAELHVNPVSIAVGAAALLVGALAATVAWQGISLPGPLGPITLFPGMKDSGFGKDISARYALEKQLRRVTASGGVIVTADPGADPSVVAEDPECMLLNRE